MRARLLALAVLCGACNPSSSAPGSNRCASDDDCPAGSSCHDSLQICAAERPSDPYRVMLQVSDLGGKAGGLTQFTLAAREITGSSDDNTLEVPTGTRVQGLVSARVDGKVRPVIAQLSFVPRLGQSEQLVSPIVANSLPVAEGNANFSIILAPDRLYDVTIFPLGADSALFPPVRATFASEPSKKFNFQYGDLTVLEGQLEDEGHALQAGKWLRVRAGEPLVSGPGETFARDQVVSSLAITGEDGAFSLRVLPGVLGMRAFVVEVSLTPEAPWGTTIELQADRVAAMSKGKLVIPVVPAQVDLRESVETEPPPDDPTGGKRLPNADITFVSTFPVPEGEGAVNDRDWCKAKTLGDMLSPFVCKSQVTTVAGVTGEYRADLFPGDYQVYISPNRDDREGRARITTASVASVETQPGGQPQSGQVRQLPLALPGDGAVLDGQDRAIANAVVNMLPLKVSVPPDAQGSDAGSVDPQGSVGLFNRSSADVTGEDGEFAFPVDRGVFDFVVRPPDESGYAWFIKPNRKVTEGFRTRAFRLPAPVVMTGVVTSAGSALSSARVDAYTFVRDPATASQERAILIATTTSDEQGRYTLRLPPSVAE